MTVRDDGIELRGDVISDTGARGGEDAGAGSVAKCLAVTARRAANARRATRRRAALGMLGGAL